MMIMDDKKRTYNREYQRKRYHTDSAYRKKMISNNAANIKRRLKEEPSFRKKRNTWAATSRHRISDAIKKKKRDAFYLVKE